MALPKFVITTYEKYSQLESKDNDTLYFIKNKYKIFKGDQPYTNVEFVKDLPEKGVENLLYVTFSGELHIWEKYTEEEKELFRWKQINKFESDLSDEKVTSIPVSGEAIKKYVQYKFDHAPIHVDASNIQYDNKKVGKTELTNMQEVLDQVFTISDSIRKQFAVTIGSSEENTFQQVADDLIIYKRKLAELLRVKGLVAASATQPLLTLINRVGDIEKINILKNTKLNVEAGTIKELELKHAVTLDKLCMSIIKYVPGDEGKEHYSCHFDNSDAVNFELNENIEFNDGVMRQKPKTLQLQCEDKGIVNQGTEDEGHIYSVKVDKSLFHKICDMEIDELDDGKMVLNITGSEDPVIVNPTDDIDLTHVYEITNVNWKTNVGNNNKLLVIFSFDGGKTYKSFYQDQLVTVDPKNLEEVSEKGMNQSTINSLTNVQWEKLRAEGNVIRPAYYFEVNDTNQKCENDDLTMKVDMKGINVIPETDDYKYELAEDGTKVLITFKKKGTYTIIWADEDPTEIKKEESLKDHVEVEK